MQVRRRLTVAVGLAMNLCQKYSTAPQRWPVDRLQDILEQRTARLRPPTIPVTGIDVSTITIDRGRPMWR